MEIDEAPDGGNSMIIEELKCKFTAFLKFCWFK